MGLLGEDQAVLEGPRLGLVGVADRVLRLGLLAGDDLPLLARREAGTAHAPQARVLQRGDDRLRAQVAGERAAQEPVAFGPGLVGVVRAALAVATQRLGLLVLAGSGGGDGGAGLGERQRTLVDRRGRGDIAAPQARDLDDLDLDVLAVRRPRLADPLVRAVQPACQVVAHRELNGLRWRLAEVRIERDHPFDLIQRPARVARERHELLAREPPAAALDGGQRRDQAGTRELAGPRLSAGVARLDTQAGHAPSREPVDSCSVVLPERSIRTAQNLNSGILPTGSISSIVRRLAAASRKWNGTKHVPGVSRCDRRARSSIVPRREVRRTKSPSLIPIAFASSGFRKACGSGWIESSANERRVIEPVCQCSSRRPVLRMNGYSADGSSLAGSHSAGTRCARPSSVPKRSSKSTIFPSLFSGSGLG